MADSNNNNNNNKRKILFETIKKVDLKHVVKVFTLFWGLILIVLITITNLGLNEKFDWIFWLSNSLILFGIMVFGLLMGESSGNDKQKGKENGLYQTTLQKYENYNKEIVDELVYFNQFYSWMLPQEITSKKIDYLIALGVDPNKAERIVKYCTSKDLKELKEHAIEVQTEDNAKIIIRQLEEHEVDPVQDVLTGSIKLRAANANYFLSAFSEGKANYRIVEEGNILQRERKKKRNLNRTIKIVSSLAISLIWGLLTVSDFIKGEDTQAWVNLVSRITALFTSFFSGWVSSVVDIKLQARIIENKFKVLQYFHNCLSKKLFIPKAEEQLAKEEYEKYLAQKKEKEAKIIIPEVVEENPALEHKEEKETGELSIINL